MFNTKYRSWSKSAILCYNIGCRCSKCTIVPEKFKDICKMKQSVLELVRVYGRPQKES